MVCNLAYKLLLEIECLGNHHLRQSNRHGSRVHTLHHIFNECFFFLHSSAVFVEGDLVGNNGLQKLEELGFAVHGIGNLVLLDQLGAH